jgi:hypothetical protein
VRGKSGSEAQIRISNITEANKTGKLNTNTSVRGPGDARHLREVGFVFVFVYNWQRHLVHRSLEAFTQGWITDYYCPVTNKLSQVSYVGSFR